MKKSLQRFEFGEFNEITEMQRLMEDLLFPPGMGGFPLMIKKRWTNYALSPRRSNNVRSTGNINN